MGCPVMASIDTYLDGVARQDRIDNEIAEKSDAAFNDFREYPGMVEDQRVEIGYLLFDLFRAEGKDVFSIIDSIRERAIHYFNYTTENAVLKRYNTP